MEWWMWLILVVYLLIGLKKTGDRMGAGMRGTSPIGTLIFGTLFWPFL
jgi:hypothetical protein